MLAASATLTRRDARSIARIVRREAHPLVGEPSDFDPVLQLVGDTRFVLIGDASHGTHEFYRARAEITKRLIAEHGFRAVAVEADWPDAYRVNRFVRGEGSDRDASEGLGAFRWFPQWMWRNADVLDFVRWLRAYNDAQADESDRVGFYGLDLYSMHRSMAEVLAYLETVDPEAAMRARHRYACFDPFPDDQSYGYAAGLGLSATCEAAVIDQLVELQLAAERYAKRDGRDGRDALFFVEQSARLVRNAEHYYRTLFVDEHLSWNVRERHMAETLEALAEFLTERAGKVSAAPARMALWAHNSHLGDARATEMFQHGEVNLGQLVRAKHRRETRLIGLTTSSGTVTAADDWDGAALPRVVRPPLDASYEAVFHDVGLPRFLLGLTHPGRARRALMEPRLERAIGVIYRPEAERVSHYFQAVLPQQFDMVLHYDATRAVEPLERTGERDRGDLPETYPSAL